MTIMCSTRPLDWFLSCLAWCPICSQDLGRYADLEHAWAFGVAIAVRKDILGHCFGAQRDSVGDCWEWYTEFGRCASGQS